MLGVLFWAGRYLTFWYDEWSIILDRSDPSVSNLLNPHVDHLALVPIAIYQVLLRLVGLRSYWPYIAINWACHLGCVWLLYRIVARWGDARLALIASLSLLTLGSAFEDLLNAWQMSFMLPPLGGLLAVDLMERCRSRWRVAAAAVALGLAVGSSSVDILFLVLVLAWGVVGRQPSIVASGIPALVAYATWYALWGRNGVGPIGLAQAGAGGLIATFGWGLGAAVASIVGLPPYRYALVGLALGMAALVQCTYSGVRPPPLGVAAGLALVLEYALHAVFRAGLGIDHAARSGYLYPAAVLLWLAISATLRGHGVPRLGSLSGAVTIVALLLGITGNLVQLRRAAIGSWRLRQHEVAILRETARRRTDPSLAMDVSPDESLVPQVTARRYFRALDRFGPLVFADAGLAR